MKKDQNRFFICRRCGNMIGMIYNSGVPIVCCGVNMEQLVANTTDGANEKHLPVIKQYGNNVVVEVSP